MYKFVFKIWNKSHSLTVTIMAENYNNSIEKLKDLCSGESFPINNFYTAHHILDHIEGIGERL